MNIFNSYRVNERRIGKKQLKKLDDLNNKILFIHYSCESFYGKAGYTPRITSIGVLNKENNESYIFSIHLTAQILKKDIKNLTTEDLDIIEKQMLDEFSQFVQMHLDYYWVHWNMSSASYGFQAISNRYRILGGSIINIPDTNKIDLPAIFGKLFTYSFEGHKPNGQLLNLANRNHISVRDALPGIDEASAFDNKEYLKLHMSTLRKVDIIDRLYTSYKSNKLIHNARIKEIYDITIPGILELIKDSPILIGIWSLIIFIIGAACEPIIQKIFGTN